MKAYPAIITKEDDAYIVLFPDFNLMSTFGETYEEALEMGADALAGTLGLMKMGCEEFPEVSEANTLNVPELLKKADLAPDPTAQKVVISVDVDEYIKKHLLKSVRKSVTIPEWLDHLAKSNHLNLSKLLQSAIKAELGLH